jgi:methylenetetrahydrofolate/methylenetetrahydromethanopterin dehydrogenase (NADP+)
MAHAVRSSCLGKVYHVTSCFRVVLDGMKVAKFNVPMSKSKILIQLDTDPKASVFDAVVAVDAGIDHLFQYSDVSPEDVRSLVHGAMYTRGPADLNSTAIFIGGSNVSAGEAIAAAARDTLFDPFRVSIMLDSNGANSTAAAAVLCATQHQPLAGSTAVVMAATGSVGQRICQILVNAHCTTYVASRMLERSQELVAKMIAKGANPALLKPIASIDLKTLHSALASSHIVFGCGAAGVSLLDEGQMAIAKLLKVAIDLNAVPPVGIAGIGLMDKAKQRADRFDYGALGVGGLKMKIHKASIKALFESNSQFLDCQEMIAIGARILASC